LGVERALMVTQLPLTHKAAASSQQSLTPLMRQYGEIKKQCPDAILFFRLGDFYEMFFEDAVTAAPILDIALTSRDKKAKVPIPLCGVPYHSAKGYITKLLDAGFKVALCEQTESPTPGKKIVARAITKIITPSTRSSEEGLSADQTQWIMSITGTSSKTLVWLDVQEGVIEYAHDLDLSQAHRQVQRVNPSEVVSTSLDIKKLLGRDVEVIDLPPMAQVKQEVVARFKVHDIDLEGEALKGEVYQSLHMLLTYIEEINLQKMGVLQVPGQILFDDYLKIDAATFEHLDIFSKNRPSLFALLNRTQSATGLRTLQKWLKRPLRHIPQIQDRLDAVAYLIQDTTARQTLQKHLKCIRDVGRGVNRVMASKAKVSDLLAIRVTLQIIPSIQAVLAGTNTQSLKKISAMLDTLESLSKLLEQALKESPEQGPDKKNIICDGYDARLDQYRTLANNHAAWMAELESNERKRTGIGSLKIGYNKVFGYYLEATKIHLDKIPDDYIRKQTLVNAERYITPSLKDKEQAVLEAKANITEREHAIFEMLTQACQNSMSPLIANQDALGQLDALLSLADVSCAQNYCRPQWIESSCIDIKKGRHPVVEHALMEVPFVPNDVKLDDDHYFMLLTGPNMAGKSTVMRQVALIVMMAQIGCFVPAEHAKLGIVDQIFTRIGAQDDVSQGQSTFMVEMNEAAHILQHATNQSLILLDEIGRGTSTFDGLSIAWAVSRHIHDKIKAKTMFATHYHELGELAASLPAMVCYQMRVRIWKSDIIFLRKLEQGRAEKSYGIEVAQLAGLPSEVIAQAKEALKELENNVPISKDVHSLPLAPSTYLLEIQNQLDKIDLDNMTPRQAWDVLFGLKAHQQGTC